MNAYLPRDATTCWLAVGWALGNLALGYAVTRLPPVTLARLAAWTLAVVAALGMERLCRDQPAGVRMVALCGVLLHAMKTIVCVESQAAGEPRLTLRQWLAFALLWPGMRPAIFARRESAPLPGAATLLALGTWRLFQGVALVLLARGLWLLLPRWLPPGVTLWLTTICLLVGLSLALHFGLFNLIAGAWRQAGIDCRALFRAPLKSRSLTEFWGRRWNLAFTEMTAIGVYRPLENRLGPPLATLLAFGCSGLLHEMAISVPVRAGYGLPLLYFVLHGTLVLVERGLERLGHPVSRHAWLGRLWTTIWLVAPLPLLFHLPFLRGVVWPIIGIEANIAR